MLWHLKLQGNPKVTQPSIQMMVLACRVATSQVGVCNSSPARSASEAAMAGKWPELFVVVDFPSGKNTTPGLLTVYVKS